MHLLHFSMSEAGLYTLIFVSVKNTVVIKNKGANNLIHFIA